MRRSLYQDRIVADPSIMAGKPTVRGTRIPVERVLGHLARDPDLDALLAALPRLTEEDVGACLGYARRLVELEGRRLQQTSSAPPSEQEEATDESLLAQARQAARKLVDEDGQLDPRLQPAIEELEALILAKYPAATFEVGIGGETAFHLYPIVDVEDDDEVMDLVIDRVVELQVDEGIPLHVIPLRRRN